MRKLYLFILALLSTMGAGAQTVPARLTADELNSCSSTQRIVIELAHETSRNYYITPSYRQTCSNSNKNIFPAKFVYNWEVVTTGSQYVLKSEENSKYMPSSGWDKTTYVEDASSAAKFHAVKPIKDGTGEQATSLDGNLVYDGRESDTPYWVRFSLGSTWINANGQYNSGTGAWTVFYVYDLSEYRKLTLTVNKDGSSTVEEYYVNPGFTYIPPVYEGYISDCTSYVMPSENSTLTINYTNKYTLTVGQAGWSTIYLGSKATIPASGVTVYGVTVSGNKAMLNQVTGVIEANRGYLVNANLGNYDFYYTTDEASSVESQLLGSIADENVAKETNYTHYVLSKVNDVVGFYAVLYNQESDTKFKNNANRAYLKVANSSARMLAFDFGTETGIEAVEAAETAGSAAVYDLCGRRVQKAQKGLYVVNGKVVIK